jgi:hypothetical protein
MPPALPVEDEHLVAQREQFSFEIPATTKGVTYDAEE